jgi:hypothetical protein
MCMCECIYTYEYLTVGTCLHTINSCIFQEGARGLLCTCMAQINGIINGHIYIHINIHTYTHTYIYLQAQLRAARRKAGKAAKHVDTVCACLCMYVDMFMCTCVFENSSQAYGCGMCVCVSVYEDVHICMYAQSS